MPSSTPPTPEDLTAWLTERLAVHARVSQDEIRPDVPMASYGLDSVNTVTMLVEIEDELGLVLDPNVPWDYPTIEALAGYLLGEARQLGEARRGEKSDAQGG
ncbi:Acyl carrier protein [Streptomyces zhaozhouensis]|uniref:Acyl carrier protein n=1 Tax=Streptomyces zhaozhouensis TaxID=1300267 RepID=A0A286E0M6_9ACTN|nr:acyl carrier protein [Streptomyces zhaozhouensis]SOD64425.1 Acyl carrier protein [Streptomyces zhaozhouensis]